MFILNLQSKTLGKSFAAAAKGEVAHARTKADLAKVEHGDLLALYNNVVEAEDALGPDTAPGKVQAALWDLLAANKDQFDVQAPKAEGGSKERGKRAPRHAGGATKAQAKREGKPAKKAGAKRGPGRQASVADEAKIKLLVKENPKRQGTASFKRFALYGRCKTVGEFIAKGGKHADLAWDGAHGYVKVA